MVEFALGRSVLGSGGKWGSSSGMGRLVFLVLNQRFVVWISAFCPAEYA